MAHFGRVIIVCILCVWVSNPVQAEKRVALVIGNSEYPVGRLRNPRNDAEDLAAALARLQFMVLERKDLTIREFDNAFDAFIQEAKDAEVAIFFFSGHGVQIDKRGYLVPIDAKLETESSALRELVAIQDVVSRIEHSAKISVIILDACRDSPLQDRLRRVSIEKNKAILTEKGLPRISPAEGNTLVVYATVPGEIADDGDGRNSPFTTALLRHIETPGLDIELMFKRVTADVLDLSGGMQQPERLSRLQSELILRNDAEEQRLWESVRDSADPVVIGAYLRKFPAGRFSDLAQTRIKQIEDERELEEAIRLEEERRADQDKRDAEVTRLEETLKARAVALQAQKVISKMPEGAGQGPEANKANETNKQYEAKLTDDEQLRQLEEELRRAKAEAQLAKEVARIAAERRAAAQDASDAQSKMAKNATEFGKDVPQNLNALSLKYWPRNTFDYEGQTRSTRTPYGLLTCTSRGRNTPRACLLRR